MNQPQIVAQPILNPKNNHSQQTFNVDYNPPSLNVIEDDDIQLRDRNVPSKFDFLYKEGKKNEEIRDKDQSYDNMKEVTSK